MVQFLEEMQGTSTPGLSSEELIELEQLRAKHEKLKHRKVGGQAAAQVSQVSAAAKKKKAASEESGSSSDSEVSRTSRSIT